MTDSTPDPRIEALGAIWPLSPMNRRFFGDILRIADDADRAAGVVRLDTTDPAVKERLCRTIENEGGAPGNSIHSWRCEYPDRYGPCTCVSDLMETLLTALREDQ